MAALLLAGGLAVGCLAELAEVLGGDSQDVLFSGQAGGARIIAEGSVGVVIVVLLAKAAAYGICLGCGFRGGPRVPGDLHRGGARVDRGDGTRHPPPLAVAVGTAAGMAAATRLLISSLVMAALLVGTGGVDITPACARGRGGVANGERAEQATRLPAADVTPRLTWLGHSTVLRELSGQRLLTDPALRGRMFHLRRQRRQAWLDRAVLIASFSHLACVARI